MLEIEPDSIDMIATSPPYWGKRDYGEDVVAIWGGEGFYWTVKEGREAAGECGLYIVVKRRGVLLYGGLCYGSLAGRGVS